MGCHRFFTCLSWAWPSVGGCGALEQIGKAENYSADILTIFTDNLRATQKNYRAAVKTVEKKNLTREVAQSSLGLPDEYYGDYLHNWHSEDDF